MSFQLDLNGEALLENAHSLKDQVLFITGTRTSAQPNSPALSAVQHLYASLLTSLSRRRIGFRSRHCRDCSQVWVSAYMDAPCPRYDAWPPGVRRTSAATAAGRPRKTVWDRPRVWLGGCGIGNLGTCCCRNTPTHLSTMARQLKREVASSGLVPLMYA